MKLLEITTTVGCKNNCFYCPQRIFVKNYLKRSNKIFMDFKTFKTCLGKIPVDVRISFGGMSEPFQNPVCTEMVLFAKKRGYPIDIFTTTAGISLEDIKNILKKLSLDNDPHSDRLFIHIPSSGNLESFPVDREYIDKLNFLLDSNNNVEFHYHGNQVRHDLQKLPFGNKLRFWPQHDRASNTTTYLKKGKRKYGKLSCGYLLEENNLQPNGDVLVCCQDFGMKHVLGNLLTQNYDTLFSNLEYKKIQKGLDDEKSDILCRYCHFAIDKNAKAILLNSPFSLKTISLALNKLIPSFPPKHTS